MGQWGVEGADFLTLTGCPKCMLAYGLFPLCWKKKKTKMCRKWSRNTVPTGTMLKNHSVGLKITVPAGIVIEKFKNLIFLWLFQLAFFGHVILNVHGHKNWIFCPSKSHISMSSFELELPLCNLAPIPKFLILLVLTSI